MIRQQNKPFEEKKTGNILINIIYRFVPFWPLFIISFIVSIICGWLFLKFQTPVFEATAQILLKNQQSSKVEAKVLDELVNLEDNTSVENEIELIKSSKVINKVVNELNLNIPIYFKGKFRDILSYNNSPVTISSSEPELLKECTEKIEFYYNKNTNCLVVNEKKYELDTLVNTPYGKLIFHINNKQENLDKKSLFYFNIHTVKNTSNQIVSRLRVTPNSKEASTILLKFIDPVSARSEKILNTIIKVYNEVVVENKNQKAVNTIKFINGRIQLINTDLKLIESEIEAFKSKNGITDLTSVGSSFLTLTNEINKSLTNVQIQKEILLSIQNYIGNKSNTPGLVPATNEISDPVLLNLLSKLIELEFEKNNLEIKGSQNTHSIQVVNNKISRTKIDINENIKTINSNLSIKEKTLNNELEKVKLELYKIPFFEQELLDLNRQQTIKNNIFTFLLQTKEEAELSYAATISDGIILDNAQASNVPIKPIPLTVYLIAISLSIIIVLVYIFVKEDLNNKIIFRSQIEEETSAEVIAEINFNESKNPIAINLNNRSIIAEQLRSLRTSVQNKLQTVEGCKVVLFTSSISGEGKSFLSVNLASSLAISGQKVAIMELDLRKPKISNLLNVQREPGITNYLLNKIDLAGIIIEVPNCEGLFVIPAGIVPPNPTELILNGKLDILINELKQKFDYIIIDSPPIGLVTDAKLLDKYSNLCLYVIRHNFTLKYFLKMIQKYYTINELHNINLIYNGLKKRGVGNYNYNYGYGYGYGYGYNYGYGNSYTEEETEKSIPFYKKFFTKK
ncbi:MAG: GumC family protein [Bacteroidia bacterium]